MKKHNLCSILKAKKPYLSKMHIKKKLKFCKLQRKWNYNDWQKIIFSDESKFNLFGSDAGQRTWCNKNLKFDKFNIGALKKFGGGNLMVWGCITAKGVGKFLRVSHKINSKEYCDVLYNGFIKSCEMHNYSPCHKYSTPLFL